MEVVRNGKYCLNDGSFEAAPLTTGQWWVGGQWLQYGTAAFSLHTDLGVTPHGQHIILGLTDHTFLDCFWYVLRCGQWL